MFSVSWIEIRELVAEHVAEWLDFLKQLDLSGELRELAQLVAAAEMDANLIGVVVLYVVPLVWLMRRWRRGGFLAVLTGVIRLFVLAVFLMFAVVALLVRLEGAARTAGSLSRWMQWGGVAKAAVGAGGWKRRRRRRARGANPASPTTTASHRGRMPVAVAGSSQRLRIGRSSQ